MLPHPPGHVGCNNWSIDDVNKTFSKNVQGCRGGSTKNHRTTVDVETGHTNTAQITPSLHPFFLYVRYFFYYALRLLGNDIVHEKRM